MATEELRKHQGPPEMLGAPCDLSLVVVAYNMDRELPRTLLSLAPPYQRGVDGCNYEIIVLDNGSHRPPDLSALSSEVVQRLRLKRIENASPSPATAINAGLDMARGNIVGLMIDGARLASPGLVGRALQAMRLHDRAIVATLGFHLGPDIQTRSIHHGYDRDTEDRLLAEANWQEDGYNLFAISALGGSSAGGWFRPIAESNALFMTKAMWRELDGVDERFQSPGGGAINLDTYVRACALPDSELVVLLGEGTFHQVHGGVATNSRSREVIREILNEYEQIRGAPFLSPTKKPIYLGQLPRQCMPWLAHSIEQAG